MRPIEEPKLGVLFEINVYFRIFFDLSDFSHILFIDPDYTYSSADAIKIISYERVYNKEYDIISGFTIFNNIFYDRCATRLYEHTPWGG